MQPLVAAEKPASFFLNCTRCPNVYEGWCEYLEGRLCMLKLKVLCRTAFVGYTWEGLHAPVYLPFEIVCQ
jgi:hypothetical protein